MTANPSRRVHTANTIRVFSSAASADVELAIEDDEGRVGRLPVLVEFQTVGDYGFVMADGTQLTYSCVVAGVQKVMAPRRLLAQDDSTDPSDAVTIVCSYN